MTPAARLAFFAVAGAAAGRLRFLLLWRSVKGLLATRSGAAALPSAAGLALVAALLVAAALAGAGPLLAALAGFLVARAAALREARR